jgi:hypothetical protein
LLASGIEGVDGDADVADKLAVLVDVAVAVGNEGIAIDSGSKIGELAVA